MVGATLTIAEEKVRDSETRLGLPDLAGCDDCLFPSKVDIESKVGFVPVPTMKKPLIRLALTMGLSAALAMVASAQDGLKAGFENPPKAARPHTWWHWINGNITKRGITADLEAMKQFGLGGAQIFNVDVGIPAGKQPFMSDSWKDSLAWAFKEAKRLGLEIDIHNGAGWSSSGGPWVTPDHAMQRLTWTETIVQGPTHFEGPLPEPKKTWGFYRDIAVYAVRKPSDDKYRIADIRQKAAFDRGDRLDPNPKLIPANAVTPLEGVKRVLVGSDGKVSIDLPEGDWTLIRMGYTPTGEENHPAPQAGLGPEVDKLSRAALDQFWTGMMAAAVKANGPISKNGLIGALIDSYEVGSQNWTPKFRQDFIRLRGYDPMPYLPTVTGRVIGGGEQSEKFLWDLRRTVCDLFDENYYGYMAELCHQHGLIFSTEGYGNGSFDNLEVNGTPDIPMAEFWVGGGLMESAKMVSSSAHIYGKPVVGAEAFTADTPHAKWLFDPYSLKALGDQAFSLGVNRYIFHRYALQPWLDASPGMTMGPWGTNFDRTITWWLPGRAWIEYVTRCQYLLQQGHFKADVLVFEGDDGPNDLPMMKDRAVPTGYDYDGIDSKTLQTARVENGAIVLPSGMRYRLLVLPNSPWTTLKSLRKVSELVQAGATVLGQQPNQSPTLGDGPQGDDEVQRLAASVWSGHLGKGKVFSGNSVGGALAKMRLVPDFTSSQHLNWIHRSTGAADIYFVANPEYQPVDVQATFRVVGRTPELWDPVTGRVQPALTYRTSGQTTTVPLRLESAGSVFVVFHKRESGSHLVAVKWEGKGVAALKPPVIRIESARYEASDGTAGVDVADKVRALVSEGQTRVGATNDNFGDPSVNHVKHLRVVYTVNGKASSQTVNENDTVFLVTPGNDDTLPTVTENNGKLLAWRPGKVALDGVHGGVREVTANPSAKELALQWDVFFPPRLGAPPKIHLNKLISWPDSKIDGVKYFSGTATYHTKFDAGRLNRKGAEYWLDLGKVKNLAEVTLNGHALPTLWKAPFRLDVSPWIRSGSNRLEVKVTNLWPNRLIGDERYPPEAKYDGPIHEWPAWVKNGTPRPPSKRVTFTTWQFFGKDDPLLESGLIGPVRLLRVPEFDVK